MPYGNLQHGSPSTRRHHVDTIWDQRSTYRWCRHFDTALSSNPIFPVEVRGLAYCNTRFPTAKTKIHDTKYPPWKVR